MTELEAVGLFIRLYLDEDVDVRVASIVRSRGFTAITTQEAGMLGATDEEQMVYATANKLAIFTHNCAHFARLSELYAEQGRTHYGVFVAAKHSYPELARRLLRAMNQVTSEELVNMVYPI